MQRKAHQSSDDREQPAKYYRLDSLFLDEGFGALDEDALETVLGALSELWNDGKLIGIISNISALKERIHAQIEIQPSSNGRSSLSGHGCEKIN